MQCDKWKNFICALLDDELGPVERQSLQQHLQQCLDCRRYQQEMEKTVMALRQVPRFSVPEGFAAAVTHRALQRRRPGFRPLLRWSLRLAAVFLLAVSVVPLLLIGVHQWSRQREIANKSPSISPQISCKKTTAARPGSHPVKPSPPKFEAVVADKLDAEKSLPPSKKDRAEVNISKETVARQRQEAKTKSCQREDVHLRTKKQYAKVLTRVQSNAPAPRKSRTPPPPRSAVAEPSEMNPQAMSPKVPAPDAGLFAPEMPKEEKSGTVRQTTAKAKNEMANNRRDARLYKLTTQQQQCLARLWHQSRPQVFAFALETETAPELKGRRIHYDETQSKKYRANGLSRRALGQIMIYSRDIASAIAKLTPLLGNDYQLQRVAWQGRLLPMVIWSYLSSRQQQKLLDYLSQNYQSLPGSDSAISKVKSAKTAITLVILVAEK